MDTQNDFTLLHPRPSASSNGNKSPVIRKGRCSHFNIADVSQFKCHRVGSGWPRTRSKVMTQQDVVQPDSSRGPQFFFSALCDLFPALLTVNKTGLVLSRSVIKKLPVFMAFCCFFEEGGWFLEFRKGDSSSAVLIHSIFNCTGKTLAPVPGTGAARGRKQCLEFVKKKKKTWVIPTCQTQNERLLFLKELLRLPLFYAVQKSQTHVISHQII